MANYTTTIYDILDNKVLYPDGILPKDYPFYTDDAKIKKEFEDLFIAHYMTSEIGFETVFRWQQAFKAKMMLITPMMKQRWDLYQDWEKDLDYLYDTNNYTDTRTVDTTDSGTNSTITNDSGSVKTTSTAEGTSDTTSNDSGTNNTTTSNEGTSNTTTSNEGTSNTTNKNSDTNNGVAIIDATDGALTSESTSNVTTNDSGTSNTTSSNEGTSNTTSSNTGRTEEVFKHEEKRTSLMYPSADLVVKRRELLFDLNREIIEQCRDLFMMIY